MTWLWRLFVYLFVTFPILISSPLQGQMAQPQPTNLKDRIAAFQQLYGTPAPLSPSVPPTPLPAHGPHSAGLRAKIAKFEQKGGVPVPRGSFGLGAPPPADPALSRRRGELYGNRIPSVTRSPAMPSSRAGSPLPPSPSLSPPSRSTSAAGFYADVEHGAYELPPSPESPTPTPVPRRSSFLVALEAARRVASAEDGVGRLGVREEHAAALDTPGPKVAVARGGSGDSLLSDGVDVEEAEGSAGAVEEEEERVGASAIVEEPVPIEEEKEGGGIVEEPASVEEEKEGAAGMVEKPVPVVEEKGAEGSAVVENLVPVTEEKEEEGSVVVEEPVPVTEEKGEESSVVVEEKAGNSAAVEDEALPTENSPALPIPALEITVESFGPEGVLSPTIIDENLLVAEELDPPSSAGIPLPDPPTSAGLLSPDSVFDYHHYLEEDVHEAGPQERERSPVASPTRLSPKSSDRVSLPSPSPPPSPSPSSQGTLKNKNTSPSPSLSPSPSPSPSLERSPKLALATPSPISTARPVEGVDGQETFATTNGRPDTPKSPPGNFDVLSPYSISDYFAPTPPASASFAAFASPPISIEVESPPFSPSSSYIVASPPLLSPDPNVIFVRAPAADQVTTRPVSMIEASDIKVANGKHTPEVPPSPRSPEGEPGSPAIQGHSRSQSHSQIGPSSFSAVVHRRVAVTPSASVSSVSKAAPPETPPPPARGRRTNKPEAPVSPGYGELATLLEEAALLERRLLAGDIPGEDLRRSPEPMPERLKLGVRAKSSTGVSPERGRPSLQRSSTSLSIHAAPLRSRSRKSREPALPPPTGALPSIPGQRGEVRRVSVDDISRTPSSTGRSSFPRYIASLRRLASGTGGRAYMTMPGYPRHSASTSSEISSEDSVPVATPPEHSVEFGGGGGRRVHPGSGTGTGVGAWPMGSPKKNGSLTRVSSRASSFAEKLWNNRKRTKSTTSSTDTSGDSVADDCMPRQLSPIVTLPQPQPQPQPYHTVPPLRSSSLIHDTGSPPRPPSWVSLSTSSTIASPLFDRDIFDAFPSVPQDTPTLLPNHPALPFPHAPSSPGLDSQATTPTDVKFNVVLSPSNTMPLRPRINSVKTGAERT